MRSLQPARLLLTACCIATAVSVHAAQAPLAVGSIRPLELLLRAVAGDAVDARALPAVRASAHDFVLRPSDLRLLRAADAVFWIGPALERPLGELLQRLPAVPAIALLPEPAAGGDRHAAHDHAAGEDPHIWLDPRAASALARRIAAVLGERGLVDATTLAGRVARFEASMVALEAELRGELEPARTTPFIVMHDGYGHFVRRFGLREPRALALDESRMPGARTLAAVRAELLAAGDICLVSEPGVNASLLAALTRGSRARVIELDPLALAAVPGQDYQLFLRAFGRTLAACLRAAPRAPSPESAP